jgi:hypothetical protein
VRSESGITISSKFPIENPGSSTSFAFSIVYQIGIEADFSSGMGARENGGSPRLATQNIAQATARFSIRTKPWQKVEENHADRLMTR